MTDCEPTIRLQANHIVPERAFKDGELVVNDRKRKIEPAVDATLLAKLKPVAQNPYD